MELGRNSSKNIYFLFFISCFVYVSPGKSIDNSLTQNYQHIEYENPAALPKFLSRGQSYRAVIGDTIVLPCVTQDLGELRRENGNVEHVFAAFHHIIINEK